MKVFEVKTADVNEMLMPVTYATGETCMSNSSTRNAVPTVQVNGTPQPRKPGRPVTTHRKDDEELFKHLRNNLEAGFSLTRKCASETLCLAENGKGTQKGKENGSSRMHMV